MKKLSETADDAGTGREQAGQALAPLSEIVANEALVLARHGDKAQSGDLVVGVQRVEPGLGAGPDRLVRTRQLDLQRDDLDGPGPLLGQLYQGQTGLAHVPDDRLAG